jgi:hypothetical protein
MLKAWRRIKEPKGALEVMLGAKERRGVLGILV